MFALDWCSFEGFANLYVTNYISWQTNLPFNFTFFGQLASHHLIESRLTDNINVLLKIGFSPSVAKLYKLRLFCLLRDDAEKMTETIMNNKGLSFKVGESVQTIPEYIRTCQYHVIGIITQLADAHRVFLLCQYVDRKDGIWHIGKEDTIHVDWLEHKKEKTERKKGKEIIPIYQA
ncbi:MAG: hypothetical protein ABIH76_06340 [Candidatus Bathyarchaeota archaeon]